MKIAFYHVDENYIQLLKDTEISERGFTTVPNMRYNKRDKFVYGVVLSINDINYYVPFSHYDRQQEDNLLVMIKSHGRFIAAGSLRFNYMIPVPKKCLRPVIFSDYGNERRIILQKEYRACLSMLSKIQKKAKKTYDRVISDRNEELTKNSCMFLKLEEICKQYTQSH